MDTNGVFLGDITDVASVDECYQICRDNPDCKTWTWGHTTHPGGAAYWKRCWMKRDGSFENTNESQNHLTSGLHICGKKIASLLVV